LYWASILTHDNGDKEINMIILVVSAMFSGIVVWTVRKHRQQEQAKAVALAQAQQCRRHLSR
jgi:hypothetical protein